MRRALDFIYGIGCLCFGTTLLATIMLLEVLPAILLYGCVLGGLIWLVKFIWGAIL